MSWKMKVLATVAVILTILVLLAVLVLWYIGKYSIMDKDGMVYEAPPVTQEEKDK